MPPILGIISLSGYGGFFISWVGCVLSDLSFDVSAVPSKGCSTSSMLGTVSDGCYELPPSLCTEGGASSVITGSTIFPDRKRISLQGTGERE